MSGFDQSIVNDEKRYEIITVIEGKSLMIKNNLSSRDYLNQEEIFNKSRLRIFQLADDSLLVMPSDYNLVPSGNCDIAYIFHDKEYLKDCIRNESFPQECSMQRVFQKHQDYIMTINKRESGICNLIKERLDIDLKSRLGDSDIEKIYNSLSPQPIYEFDENFIYTAHAISLFVKREQNAKWILIRERGEYKKFYVPALMDQSGNVWMIFHDLERYRAKSSKGTISDFKTFNSFAIKQKIRQKTVETLYNRDVTISEPYLELE